MVHRPPFFFSDASPDQLRQYFNKQQGRSKKNTLSLFKDIIRLGRLGVNLIIISNSFLIYFWIRGGGGGCNHRLRSVQK